MEDATPDHLRLMDGELARLLASGAWEEVHCSRRVSRLFLVPKPRVNTWQLIIDPRPLNRYCEERDLSFETLTRLRHLARPGDYMPSMDMHDAFYAVGSIVPGVRDMDEESRGRTVANLIRTLSPKIGVQILPAHVRVVTRRPSKTAAADPAALSGTRLPTTTGSVILQPARREIAVSILHTQLTGEGTAILDRHGRRCSTRLLGAPHLDDIERPVHQVWLRSPAFRGITEADMWLRLAEGLLPPYDQPQPDEAATDQPAATPADVLALAGRRAGAEYEADTYADDAVICPPTRTLLALLEVREDREDQPTTPLPGVLPPALSKRFFQCALTAKAICTGPVADLELPTVEKLAEAIATTISQRIDTPPELQHAPWLTDTVKAAGVEMHRHHTEPTLMHVGDDNHCAISLGKEDEEFADTLRLEVALTSPVALLRAIRLRTIVIYLKESEYDPSELLIHPIQPDDPGGGRARRQYRPQPDPSNNNRPAKEGPQDRPNVPRPASHRTPCLHPHPAADRPPPQHHRWHPRHRLNITVAQASVDGVREDQGRASPDINREAPCRHLASPTTRMPGTTTTPNNPGSPDRTAATAPATTAVPGAQADDEEELELNYEETDSAIEVDTTQGAAAETPGQANISLDSHQRSTVHRTFREGTPNGSSERLAKLHHLTTAATELLAQSSPASQPAVAAKLASLAAESHQLRNAHRLSIQLERHPSQPTPTGKGKAATKAKPRRSSQGAAAARTAPPTTAA
eukprot:jgi/Tetstr1/445540/TSEL_033314.t1